jgi:hypothetical protein
MYKKLLFVFLIVFVLFLCNNGNTEIKNDILRSEYEKVKSSISESPIEIECEDCVRECFDDNTELLGINIFKFENCLGSYDCITCVDDCINKYELDDYTSMKIVKRTRNYCFINLL